MRFLGNVACRAACAPWCVPRLFRPPAGGWRGRGSSRRRRAAEVAAERRRARRRLLLIVAAGRLLSRGLTLIYLPLRGWLGGANSANSSRVPARGGCAAMGLAQALPASHNGQVIRRWLDTTPECLCADRRVYQWLDISGVPTRWAGGARRDGRAGATSTTESLPQPRRAASPDAIRHAGRVVAGTLGLSELRSLFTGSTTRWSRPRRV